MRKVLMATSALALAGAMAAGPASAADMLAVGVGGYMEQWIGYGNRDDPGVEGGFDTQSDSEVYFTGSVESDMGLKFGVRVQLEANNGGSGATSIDESSAWISGAFGRIDLGARDPIHTRMHYAAAFGAGAGLNAGDTQKWIPGAYLETAGWTIPGDDLTLTYVTPRTNGVQVGVSYAPDSTNENASTSPPTDNDNAAWAAAINYNETIGDMAFKISLGHVNVANPGSVMYQRYNNNAANDAVDSDGVGDEMMTGFDDKSYTNAGISIGMGAFTFGASYATRDDGGHVVECWNIDGDVKTLLACPALPTDAAHSEPDEATGTYGDVGTMAVTDVITVEDESGQHDTWAVGIGYSDGPLSLSIGHMSRASENGDERTGTEVSAGYKLAPGVSWKTSIFGVEDDTSGAEGTAFVTGLTVSF